MLIQASQYAWIIFVLGVLAFSLRWFGNCGPRLQRCLLWIGAAGIVTSCLLFIATVFSRPSKDDTVPQPDRPIPKPQPISSTLEKLRATWDSEEYSDWPVAGAMAELSLMAYEPPVFARDQAIAMGFSECMPIVSGSMIGYVVSAEDATVIIFRGTDFNELSDWIANLSRHSTGTDNGSIHSGFYNSYLVMKPQIQEILPRKPPKSLWITGHSLAGAMALACAYDLIDEEHLTVTGLITFGQPMVASKELAGYLDAKLLGRYARFVNGDDMVPRIPPSYFDCGSLIWFTNDGIERSPPKKLFGAVSPSGLGDEDGVELKPLSEREFAELQRKMKQEAESRPRHLDGQPVFAAGFPSLVGDHSMGGYFVQVQQMLKPTN